jgi:hypothetical protein
VTTVLVLVILGLIWGFVLIPPYLQNRRESRPSDSIASFRQQLSVLERTTPGGGSSNLSRLDVGRYEIPRYDPRSNVSQLAHRSAARASQGRRPSSAAMRRAEVRRRRRDVFVTLLGAVGVSFLLALLLGGSVWMLHFVIDAAFLAYVAMLVSIQQASAERDMKVRHLPPTAARRPRPQVAPPQLAMRRYGS